MTNKKQDSPSSPDDFLRIHEGLMNNSILATLRRMIYVSALAIVSMLFLGEILDVSDIYHKPVSIILAVIGINLLSEGNFIINRILDYKMPWFSMLTKRIYTQLALSFGWLLFITLLFSVLAPRTLSKEAIMTFIFGTIFILVFNSVLFMRSFAYNWRLSIVENEKLKQAKLHADYMALQNQLNPHFLFNSFSVLISEIQYNPAGAVEFAQKMSDVYRYVLQQRKTTTVPLKSELEFLEDFRYLHKIRMGDALNLSVDIDTGHLNKQMPPMTLQVLIENAIKHNQATEKQPLNISITSKSNGTLSVRNNLNPKATTYSTGTGLENIVQRYQLLTNETVSISNDDETFEVILPLLEIENL